MAPTSFHRLAVAVVVALDGVVLRIGWVPPSELATQLGHPHRWVDAVGADSAALELARTGLWLVGLWLALALIAVLASVLPGTLGRIANGVAGRAVPAVLRRAIVAALGAYVVLVPVAAGASTTGGHRGATTTPTARASSPAAKTPLTSAAHLSGGWPWPTSASTTVPASGLASAAPAKPVPWPRSATPTPSIPGRRASAGVPSSDVVVGPGDCLWAIAAHRLGPQASAHRIAVETERWYAANATTIGPDPGLIHPGQRLHQPTEKGQ